MKDPKDTKTVELPAVKAETSDRSSTNRLSERTMKIAMPDDGEGNTEKSNALSATLPEAQLRVRMSSHDAHYGGNLVDGARLLGLFGDIATELLIRHDGDEGLFRAYENVEFLAPVRAGDYVEAVGRIIKVGATSRKMSFEAWKVISPRPDLNDSAAELLPQPVLVARAVGTCVVPKEKQRS